MKTVRRTARPIQLLAVGLLLCVLSIPAKVAAQVQLPPAAQPGQQELEPGRRPGAPDMTPRQPAEIEKPAQPGAPPKEAEGPKVLVKQFRVTGNTVIPTAKLEALVRSEEGKELTLAQLREVAARITDYYADQGYILARAYLPPQDVREGILEIAVLEGTIGKIEVTGNERYKSTTITRALTRVENAKAVNEGLLETAINDLNDYPGLNIRASLKPGETRGTTDIVLTAQERVPVNFGVDVDNYGSRFTGFWRYGVELGYGNIAGLGDKLSFRGIKSEDDLKYYRVSYLVPVGGYGTKVGLSYAHSENGVGAEFAALDAAGRLDQVSADIIQPILRTAAASFQINAGFDYKRVRNFVLNSEAGNDDLRIFRVGFNGDYRDPFLGRTYYGLTWRQGTTALGGSIKDDPGGSRIDGPGNFSVWTLDLARLQSLVYGGAYLVLRGTGQISSQNLVASEKMAVGGYYTVRGYPLSEQSGDDAYAVTAELVIPVPYLRDWVQVVGFIDHGGAFPISRNKQQGEKDHWMTGVGGGIRINIPIPIPYFGVSSLQIRADYAKPVLGPNPSSFKNGITQGDPGILYFSSSFRF